MVGKAKKYSEQLMAVFNFDEDDLEANSKGVLSNRQKLRIREDIYFWKLSYLVTLPFMLLITLLIFVTRPNTPFFTLVGGVVFGAILLWLYNVNVARPSNTINRGSVEMVEGRINQQIEGQRANIYWIEIDSFRFRMTQERFLLLKNHDPYRFYYTRKKVWSVVALRDENPFLDSTSESVAKLDEADRLEHLL